MLSDLIEFKKTDRKWHLAALAGLCVGIPILAGYYMHNVADGKLASMAGLVILYLQNTNGLVKRMITLMACSFGIMLSFTVGSIAAFNPLWSPLMLGAYAFLVHLSLFYLGMTRPPGNMFFVMLASIAICMPYDPGSIPHKVGLIGIGTMISCFLGLGYSFVVMQKEQADARTITVVKNRYVNLIESATFGFFVGISLLAGRLLKLDNPYWIPISCAAVMLGISTQHIWQRSIQRILGTAIGMLLTWALLQFQFTPLFICISIVVLQIIVEILIVRNYGIAVIFLTMLTIFLAESGGSLAHPDMLMRARFFDIVVGSLLGACGGWFLYNEQIRYAATLRLRKTRVIISKMKHD